MSSRLTDTQEAEEYGAHGSASVRWEAELSKADWVTGCGSGRCCWYSQPGSCHMGRWPASSHTRDGSLTWATSMSKPHGPSITFVSLNTVNLRGFEQIFLPLGSSNRASVYTMQDAFPKLMINLINLNSAEDKSHAPTLYVRLSSDCQLMTH